jgi:xanthine dehydrogenase accessory factor
MSMYLRNTGSFVAGTEPLDARLVAEAILRARNDGRALASITAVHGDAAGERVVIFADGAVLGSFSNPALNGVATELATQALADAQPILRETDSGFLFCEPVIPADPLIIVGAGHIAVPLAQLGCMIGFDVSVLDDREEFATPERFPEQARVQQMDFAAPFAEMSISPRAFVVLVTRAHKYDYDCIRALLARDPLPRYIGMIGSKRRVRAAFQALLDDGIAQERLALVKAPVGLDIGAETPAEIAVSIAAELVRERSGSGTGATLASEARILERFFSVREPNG